MLDEATARAPASVGNVAVGFDILGHTLQGLYDRVTVKRTARREVAIVGIDDDPFSLPTDPLLNSATRGLIQLRNDLDLSFGFQVTIDKGIPLSAGLGGSSASAVASVMAADALLTERLDRERMLAYALEGEYAASGTYTADNVAPILFGGLVLASLDRPPQITQIPVPSGIRCAVVRPRLEIETRLARDVLSSECRLEDVIRQSSHLAGFLAGCFCDHIGLVKDNLRDVLIEPQRAQLVPGFSRVKTAALDGGAMGCSLSGGGPSVFAWCESDSVAQTVVAAMTAAFRHEGLDTEHWISVVDGPGVCIE